MGKARCRTHFRSLTVYPLRQPTNFPKSRPPSPLDPNPQVSPAGSQRAPRTHTAHLLLEREVIQYLSITR